MKENPFRRLVSRLAAILSTVLVAAALAGPAHADPFFEGLNGKWSGNGFIKSDPRSPEEAIRCRLDLALSRLRDRLYVRGNCSIAGFILPVNGSIATDGRTYTANLFQNLVQVRTSSFSGNRRGSRLTLNYVGIDATTNKAIRAAMTIRKRGSGFDISLSRSGRDGKRFFDVGTIRFKSQ